MAREKRTRARSTPAPASPTVEDLVDSCKPAYKMLEKALHNDMVLITGPPSVGKRTIALRIFEQNKGVAHAYVNCYTITTASKFFSVICQEFQATLNFRKQDRGKVILPEADKPVSSHEFARYFVEYVKFAKKKNIDKLYVVLDHLEVFQKTNLMQCFSALVTITNLNIIIITYEMPMDIVQYTIRVSKTAGIRVQDRIMPVVVPTWSIEDTIKWILSFPPHEEPEIYRKFVTNVVSLCYNHDNKNPTQTLILCQDYFEDFLHFYRQNLQSGQTRNPVGAFLKSFDATIKLKRDAKKKTWSAGDVEVRLPVNTAVLIIAAYVAAYTKPSDDRRNFVRLQKRTKQKESKPEHISRPFTFERLYHIYRGLQRVILGNDSENVINDNGFVLGDVERLENLNILIHYSGWSIHPEAKYRLSPCIKRDYIDRLAKNNTLKIEYLHGLSNNS